MSFSKNELSAIKESLRYSISHISGFDYVNKYRMSFDEANEHRKTTLEPLKSALSKISELKASE